MMILELKHISCYLKEIFIGQLSRSTLSGIARPTDIRICFRQHTHDIISLYFQEGRPRLRLTRRIGSRWILSHKNYFLKRYTGMIFLTFNPKNSHSLSNTIIYDQRQIQDLNLMGSTFMSSPWIALLQIPVQNLIFVELVIFHCF